MDNQQRELEASNQPNEELEKLYDQLREVAASEDFFNLASGKLFLQLATAIVNKNTKDMLSEKFINDHNGYINARAESAAISSLLRRMQVAGSPKRKAKLNEKKGELEENGK